jgi:hypothetical protein
MRGDRPGARGPQCGQKPQASASLTGISACARIWVSSSARATEFFRRWAGHSDAESSAREKKMKTRLLAGVASAVLLSACASTGPATGWGKPNVSKVDFGTDVGTCTGLAAMQGAGNGANNAGGLTGSKSGGSLEPTKAGTPVTSPVLMGGGVYRDSAPPDVVNRAASQQRSQEMEGQRVRAEAYKGCMVQRGYQEFVMTPEQRQHVASLKPGTNEYYEYLHKIGADPQVVATQAIKAH